RGEVIYTSRAAARVAEELGGSRWGVKAQIHAGGRGKAGGGKMRTQAPRSGAGEGRGGKDRAPPRRDGRDRRSDVRLGAHDRTDGRPRSGRASPPGGTGGADRARGLPLAPSRPR